MTIRRLLVPAGVLLALMGTMAAAQTSRASAPAAAPVTAPSATASAPAQRLSPEQQHLLASADQLVSLAEDLETEVGRTSEFTLSLKTLARAAEIEKLARNLEKQMRPTKK